MAEPLLSHDRTVARRQQRRTHPPSAPIRPPDPLDACICNSSTSASSQKIKAFNEDIRTLIDGEELVEEGDTRMFNKVRTEFCRWSIMVHSSFDEGECQVPPPPWHGGLKWGAVGKGGGHEELVTGELRLLCSTARDSSQ